MRVLGTRCAAPAAKRLLREMSEPLHARVSTAYGQAVRGCTALCTIRYVQATNSCKMHVLELQGPLARCMVEGLLREMPGLAAARSGRHRPVSLLCSRLCQKPRQCFATSDWLTNILR